MFKRCLGGSLILHLLIFLGVGLYPAPAPLLPAKSQFFQLVAVPGPKSKVVVTERSPAAVSQFPQKSRGIGSKPVRPEPTTGSVKFQTVAATEIDSKVEIKLDTKVSIVTQPAPKVSVVTQPTTGGSQESGLPVTKSNGNSVGTPGFTANLSGGAAQANNNKVGTKTEPGEGISPKGYDTAPQVIYCPNPSYPIIARKNNWEGVVLIEAILEKNGRIGTVKVIQRSGYQVLDQEAVKAVKQRRYHPAVKDGEPVAAKLRIKIPFKLEDPK